MQQPDCPSEGSRTDLQRSFMLLYVLGGIAAVLMLLWQLAPPIKNGPGTGALESRYREEVARLFAQDVFPSATCNYHPKLLMLACTVPTDMEPKLMRLLLQEGWTEVEGRLQHRNLQDAGTFECRTRTSPSHCKLTLQFRGGRQ